MRALMIVAIAAFSAAPAAAQTRFLWPDTAVDLSKYTTLEECRAAVYRVQNQVRAQEFFATGVWRDTVTADDAEYGRPLEPAIPETIRACMGDFAEPDVVPLDQYRVILPLYVMAGRDDDARALVARKLASVPDTSDAFAAVVDTVLTVYSGRGGTMAIRPARIDLVDEVVAEYMPRIADRLKRFQMYWSIAGLRRPDGQVDTLRMKRIGLRVLALVDSLDERDRRRLAETATFLSEEDPLGERVVGVFDLGQRDFLDSLRVSTAAYNRAKRNAWTRATGQPPETYLMGRSPLGESAAPLEWDIQLGCDGECGPRPVPGRVNLLVFVQRSSCGVVPASDEQMYGNCAQYLVPLRRLMERFPELEVTIIARTTEHFAYVKDGVTPETEAQLTRQWLDSFGVNAPLIMSETPYWRISEYDRRRVDRNTPNQEAYSFGMSTAVNRMETGAGALLVDQDGVVVHSRHTNRWSIVEYGDMIEVLLERGK